MTTNNAGNSPVLGMIVDRSSFDETEDYFDSDAQRSSLSSSSSLCSVEDPPDAVIMKNGKVRRRLRWKPRPLLALQKISSSSSVTSAGEVSNMTNTSERSYHTFSSSETPVQSNKKASLVKATSRFTHNARPQYRGNFSGVATISSEGGFVQYRMNPNTRQKKKAGGIANTKRLEALGPVEIEAPRPLPQPIGSSSSEFDPYGTADTTTDNDSIGPFGPTPPLHQAPPLPPSGRPPTSRPPTTPRKMGPSVVTTPDIMTAADPTTEPPRTVSPDSTSPSPPTTTSPPPILSQQPTTTTTATPSTPNAPSNADVVGRYFPKSKQTSQNNRKSTFSESITTSLGLKKNHSDPDNDTNSVTTPKVSSYYQRPSEPLGRHRSEPVALAQPFLPTDVISGSGDSLLGPIRSQLQQALQTTSPQEAQTSPSPPPQSSSQQQQQQQQRHSKRLLDVVKRRSDNLGRHTPTDDSGSNSSYSERRHHNYMEGITTAEGNTEEGQEAVMKRVDSSSKSVGSSVASTTVTSTSTLSSKNSNFSSKSKNSETKTTPDRSSISSTPVDLDNGRFVEVDKNLQAIQSMAAEHLAHGEFDEALEVFVEILRGQLERHGPAHHRVGTALHNIGIVHLKKRNYDKVIQVGEQAVRVRKAALGPNHPDVAISVAQIGLAYLESKRCREALKAFQRALSIRRASLGSKHPKVAKVLNNVGCTFSQLGKPEEALKAFEEALNIQREALRSTPNMGGSQSKSFRSPLNQLLLGSASSLCNIGSIKLRLGKYEEANVALEEALLIQQSVLGDGHKTVSSTLENIDMVDKMSRDNPSLSKDLLQQTNVVASPTFETMSLSDLTRQQESFDNNSYNNSYTVTPTQTTKHAKSAWYKFVETLVDSACGPIPDCSPDASDESRDPYY